MTMVNVLRESFIPKFIRKNEESIICFPYNSAYSLNYKIEQVATTGLGYEPIRNRKEKVKTLEDLQKHLGKMDEKIIERGYDFFKKTIFALIEYVNKLERENNIFRNEIDYTKKGLDELLIAARESRGILEAQLIKSAYVKKIEGEPLEEVSQSKPKKRNFSNLFK
jgi:hypothetical protein